MRVISTRFWAALRPGLEALKSFERLVPGWAAVDAEALSSVAAGLPPRAEGTLRDRLSSMIKKAEVLNIR